MFLLLGTFVRESAILWLGRKVPRDDTVCCFYPFARSCTQRSLDFIGFHSTFLVIRLYTYTLGVSWNILGGRVPAFSLIRIILGNIHWLKKWGCLLSIMQQHSKTFLFLDPNPWLILRQINLNPICTFVGTTRGQGIIGDVIVETFFWHSHFWKIFKVNKPQILTFWA